MARTRAALDALIRKLENNLGVNQQTLLKTSPLVVEESKAQTQPSLTPKAQTHDSHSEESKVNLSEAPLDAFDQIDIRVGRITECWKHPSSESLYCEKIDLGESEVREIGSGLQAHIPLADMSGLVFVVANLKPRKLGGFNSNGMVLALHKPTGFELLRPPTGSIVGERVGVDGHRPASSEAVLPSLNPKKKILEKAMPYLMTNSEGIASFGTHRLVTSGGFITSAVPNGSIS